MYKLNSDKRYSKAEKRVFSLLPVGGRAGGVTSTMLAGILYGRSLNGRAQIVGIVQSLIAKTKRYREPFKVCKSERAGPHPSEFWVEKR